MTINEQTREYISQHADDDVRRLALKGTRSPEVDLQTALQQIAGRQTARRKLPTWAATDGIVYPPHLNMEQCSSEQTARYKAALTASLFVEKSVNGKSVNGKSVNGKSVNGKCIDLTGGLGVDFYWMAQNFEERIYVERDKNLCDIAKQNFQTLGLQCTVVCDEAAHFLATLDHADVIFLDPARRNDRGARTYDIRDCTPNVLDMLPMMLRKTDCIVMKLSPMLDWNKAAADLNAAGMPGRVSQVHIVSVDNECKELLIVMENDAKGAPRIVCADNDSIFEADSLLPTLTAEADPRPVPATMLTPAAATPAATPVDACYLYEPNASIMKAGCFGLLEQRFAVRQIAHDSHLFLAGEEISRFPGRGFRLSAVSTMNRQDLRRALAGIAQANVSVRNFPLTAQQLQKKLRLKDGGDTYIFATTMADGSHKLFIGRKIG